MENFVGEHDSNSCLRHGHIVEHIVLCIEENLLIGLGRILSNSKIERLD